MSIGILYESYEWSNCRLGEIITQNGIAAEMIFAEDLQLKPGGDLPHAMYINRVFPSADMRGHTTAIEKTARILEAADKQNIPIINSYKAFRYDCSKLETYKLLMQNGFNIPWFIYINRGNTGAINKENLELPAILKRDCGGRSYDLKMIMTAQDLIDVEEDISSSGWILQEFVEPVKGFSTRVEVIDNRVMTILKRFLGKNGISSYSMGSRYEIYKNCPRGIIEDSTAVLKTLDIEMGSLDFIESSNGTNHLIDVNATSNFTPDYIPLLGFDPIEKMAEYIISKYNHI